MSAEVGSSEVDVTFINALRVTRIRVRKGVILAHCLVFEGVFSHGRGDLGRCLLIWLEVRQGVAYGRW